MSGGTGSRVATLVISAFVGLVYGALGTIGHRHTIVIGDVPIPWGLVAALVGVACLVVGLRIIVGRWAAAAAGILLVSLATLAGAYWLGSHARVQTFATGHGEERSLQLPDNTLVQLDSDSAITIRFNEGQRRVVVDRGQAFFKVSKDPARPFSVQVGDSLIRDIGTAFNVYQRTVDTTVTVAEGRAVDAGGELRRRRGAGPPRSPAPAALRCSRSMPTGIPRRFARPRPCRPPR